MLRPVAARRDSRHLDRAAHDERGGDRRPCLNLCRFHVSPLSFASVARCASRRVQPVSTEHTWSALSLRAVRDASTPRPGARRPAGQSHAPLHSGRAARAHGAAISSCSFLAREAQRVRARRPRARHRASASARPAGVRIPPRPDSAEAVDAWSLRSGRGGRGAAGTPRRRLSNGLVRLRVRSRYGTRSQGCALESCWWPKCPQRSERQEEALIVPRPPQATDPAYT